MSSWTFLTNHAHVLLLICRDPDLRMRDLAAMVEITERAVQRIIHELVEEGYVTVEKVGRRNRYAPQLDARLRHPQEQAVTIHSLLTVLTGGTGRCLTQDEANAETSSAA